MMGILKFFIRIFFSPKHAIFFSFMGNRRLGNLTQKRAKKLTWFFPSSFANQVIQVNLGPRSTRVQRVKEIF